MRFSLAGLGFLSGEPTLIAADRQSLQMPPLKLAARCVSREALARDPFLKEG
jgi:hypothetical protein